VEPEDLAELLEQVRARVYYSDPPETAIASVAKMAKLGPAEIAEIREEYGRQARKYIELVDPKVLRGNSRIETWYIPPDPSRAWCWPAYERRLREKKWTKDAIDRLDQSAIKIVSHLSHPAKNFQTRGLVVGYVQSGKTANYAALISKAADVGYKLFIVLAGTTSSLRQQTQKRLEEDIVSLNPSRWERLTGPKKDFSAHPGSAHAILNPENRDLRIIGVVKKNKFILENLHNFLQKGKEVLPNCPVIVIDDEADNASVNTDPESRTAINGWIIKILKLLPKAAYVGYTATPFANVFIDPTAPEDLFPRDFIFDLPRPDGYFGAEKIFGRDLAWFDEKGATFEGLDIIRRIGPEEQALVQPPRKKKTDKATFEPEVPESLERAIEYFLMATACRHARGQIDHSSMLVHTTHYVSLHTKMKDRVDEVIADLRKSLTKRRDSLRKLWAAERRRSPAKGAARFDAIFRRLPEVLEKCQVVIDNGYSDSRLVYPEDDPKVYIAIGGNTLSRGLTLEGLIVSYFVRTASAYDTLLQMGRWFGYRFGYEDLPRLWMTDELEEYFFFLATVEEEIRRDIERLEKQGLGPLDLAIRVRTHPKLQITAKAKMGTAKLSSASFSKKRVQSFLFEHRDASWLRRNVGAGRELIRSVRDLGLKHAPEPTHHLFREVPARLIESFLEKYRFHEDHDDYRADLLLNYIRKEKVAGALATWSVAVMHRDRPDKVLGKLDLGLDEEVACISRSRYRMTEPCNIKALTSAEDRVLDLTAPRRRLNEEEMIDLRRQQAPGTGLLALYPISRNSTPVYKNAGVPVWCEDCKSKHLQGPRGEARRHALQAVEHVLGLALFFPESRSGDQNYVANDLSVLFQSDPEDREEQADLESAIEVDG